MHRHKYIYIYIYPNVFSNIPSLCLLQGPMGKQGIQGLPGVDGPPVSYHR